MRLVAGLRPAGPAGGAYSAPPRLPSWIKGEGKGVEKGRVGREWEGNWEGEEGKGRTPKCLQCVDANATTT